MFSKLTSVTIQPRTTHRYSIIWLHGLGADGHDFEGIVPELHLQAQAQIHFIFPNAPVQAVTINRGMAMPAWYDIISLDIDRQVDIAGIYQASAAISQLIEQEIAKGIKSEHILLAGFSQGGVIALHTGLRFAHKLAGIIALSTYLPTTEQLKTERHLANQDTPIFMAHGILDAVVAIETAKAAYDALLALGYPIEWHDYLMEHSLCAEQIQRLASFINSRFAA